jgi:hypothetical protein
MLLDLRVCPLVYFVYTSMQLLKGWMWGKRGGSVSEMKHPHRIEKSVALVKTIIDHIFSDHQSVKMYGLKKIHASYEVWVQQKGHMITVQSLTRDIILHCTDPDEATARKFQSFIERCIRQGTKVLTPDVS